MAVFREYNSGGKDRSAGDRRRHRQLVEKAIKKNLHEIVAEESIIGQSKEKKIKIPIRGLKEYQFIYGRNHGGVGTGTGKEKRGDIIAKDLISRGQGQGGAGTEEGEEIYETEITIEDLVNYIFDDLNLPYMERKTFTSRNVVAKTPGLPDERHSAPPGKKRSVMEKSNAGRAGAGRIRSLPRTNVFLP